MLFQEITLEELEAMAIETILKAKEIFNPVATFALFSGGNDSTAMLHLVKDHVDAAVHIVTGIGIPATREFVNRTCELFGVPLIERVTHAGVYAKMVIGPEAEGFPGPAWHGSCYQQLKQHRLREMQTLKRIGRNTIMFVSGVRINESKRRKSNTTKTTWTLPNKDMPRAAFANPILHFTKAHLADYRLKYGVPQSNVAALIHKSGDCLCGAFAKKGELEEIEFWFPETGAYIRTLERAAEQQCKTYCRWGWGHDKLAGVAEPGPLCSSCELFEEEIAVKEVMG